MEKQQQTPKAKAKGKMANWGEMFPISYTKDKIL